MPLTATAPPTINAKSVLGSLKFHTIDIETLCMSGESGVENILFDITFIIWSGCTLTLPNPTPIIITIILNITDNIILNFVFILIYVRIYKLGHLL